ncbi:4-alpha-glucanotransferase [Alteromonas sediminis]|uniref:4-alpha-glucanotransferase n=1 Tax=Alteromonas sediminis TaxID=2259342 RepID=A0A3N5ZBL2_9ALTE|nr:4-alpha-glucanotransferase [Alteromonas sediminis]RPJ68754.1 4-alpha-glucanotransferase [Alteromonas sediminis]
MKGTGLQSLVAMRGIETEYVDAWGEPATISTLSQEKLLGALGLDTSNEESIAAALDAHHRKHWQRVLAPVTVVRSNQAFSFTISLPIQHVNDQVVAEISCEDGSQHQFAFTPVEGKLLASTTLDEHEYQLYEILLPDDICSKIAMGYHSVSIASDSYNAQPMRFIVAPETCYKPEIIKQGKKAWGLSVQLYCLRSQNNWGIGDFGDLKKLVADSAQRGADFIGLNPIHALYPADPEACSPYGPSSRRWLNYLYIDVTAIEGYDSPAVQAIVQSDDFQTRLAHSRAAEWVDYASVTAIKLEALTALFEQYNAKYLTKNTRQNKAFKAFVAEGGESLEMLAVYDALQADLKQSGKESWGWPVFPDDLNEFQKPAVAKFKKAHAKNVKFYLFLQWQAALQLEDAQAEAERVGMTIGLYRDLAVGVSEGSAEIWGNKDLYCTQASVGAPPDILGPLGQNWGLPPMDPEKLYDQQYQPIIDLFSANMASSGALRIDHVMALLRLWWVVKGDDAKEGGYINYPVDDLLGILALESQRNQSLVIGEDLGTVPEAIRSKLADNGIYSYRVFFFEQAEDGGFFSPSHYPEQSMATLTTHDMPTLIGFWHCLDLELGKELGLYPTEEILSVLYKDRHKNKQAILDTLHGHGSVGSDVGSDVNVTGMTTALNYGMQIHMATGSSALLSLQLEDWLQMDKPVNIPGTFREYPNWKRKLSRNLEDIFDDPQINALAAKLTDARRKAE